MTREEAGPGTSEDSQGLCRQETNSRADIDGVGGPKRFFKSCWSILKRPDVQEKTGLVLFTFEMRDVNKGEFFKTGIFEAAILLFIKMGLLFNPIFMPQQEGLKN